MRLSEALAPQVSDTVRTRGAAYARSGAVADIERHGGIVHAVVIGTETYDVSIEPAGPLLRSSCTCPYFIDRLEICKHIWAVIVAAEARGIPLLDPGPTPTDISLEPIDLDGPADDWDDEPWSLTDRTAPAPPPRAPFRVAPAPRTHRVPPPWRQLLDAVTSSAMRPPDPLRQRLVSGQLLYIIDVGASLAAGAVVIELMTRDRKASGDWAKPRPARISARDIRMLPDGPERQILERLLGAGSDYGNVAYAELGELSRFRLHGVLVRELLPLICAGDRCLARLARPDIASARPDVPDVRDPYRNGYWGPPKPKRIASELLPLRFDSGPAWRFDAVISRDDPPSAYRIDGVLSRDGERMPIAEPLMVFNDGVLITRSHVARLDHAGAFPWLAAMRRVGAIAVPVAERLALIDALLAQPLPLQESPDDLRVDIEQGVPRPALRLTPAQWAGRLEADVRMIYGDLQVPLPAVQPVVRTADASRIIRRDLEAERGLVQRLHQLGFRQEWSPQAQGPIPQLPAERLPRAIRSLLAEGWHVEAGGITYRRPGSVRLAVRSGIDWFDVEGAVEYDDQRIPLPVLLAAARRGDTFVTLDDGTHGLLPEEWLNRHGALVRMGTTEGAYLRFKPSQVALLDALLAAQPAATCDETFARARRELASFDGVAPADPPRSFNGTLRGYQRDGLGWLLFLRRFGFGGCLADDMGLGKTVMVLALLARVRAESTGESPRPSLVVAPRSLVFNWRHEATRFTPALRVLDYTGSARAALRETIGDHDIVLTTYGTLRHDAAHLAEVPFDYVILDEAQAIKNAASASAKAARLLAGRHRLALSGTPVENHLGELWSLFEFLNPGVLGSAAAFAGAGDGRSVDEETLSILSRGLRPFILRRTKAQVAPELPAKTEQTVYCELERPQRVLYDELRDHYRRTLLAQVTKNGMGHAKLQVLEALLRLRQAACHPGLLDAKRRNESSAKFEVLVPHIMQAVDEGHKTLVFSQFTSLLAILRAQLDAADVRYEYLDGRTRDRGAKVERFQNDENCRLFLISLKAGGVGLNLTAAEYVFLLDPWWNPAVEAQAIDRTHRIGQIRHVFAYRLIAKDTVEERVLELQQRKRTLAQAILTADASLIRTLQRDDLELLLS
jgi:superfamily II DNA or RNA helicase